MLGLVPAILATLTALAVPGVAAAAGGYTETASTTYRVNPAKGEIDVSVVITFKNHDPGYYYYGTSVAVEAQATTMKATSNAGKVTIKTRQTGKYYDVYELDFPNVHNGQTRVVSLSYLLPAAPGAAGGFRAGRAYTEMCGIANGRDGATVNVQVPDGFDVSFTGGSDLRLSGDSGGYQTFTSGNVTDTLDFYTCLEGANSSGLTSSPLTADGQTFNVQGWPEDSKWSTLITTDVKADVSALETLTGLSMPGGTIAVREAGSSQLGNYIGTYNDTTRTVSIAEDADDATVAHELSHVWFNHTVFGSVWMSEGFAGYSEKVAGTGKYKPCTDPGTWPGAGSIDLIDWRYLTVTSTDTDAEVVDWQYHASCYLVTTLADEIGAGNFKAVVGALMNDQIAYQGAGKPEKSPQKALIGEKVLLDAIDELGMVPAQVKDLDKAQNLFAAYNLIPKDQLASRSAARASYHALVTRAGKWQMPAVVRLPMAGWDFTTATTAMTAAKQVLDLRSQIQTAVSGLSLDGSAIETKFESAQTISDLSDVIALENKELAAAKKVNDAAALQNSSRSLFQSAGLIGSDPGSLVTAAIASLKQLKPDEATRSAQQAVDMINNSTSQGQMRVGILVAVLLVLLLLVVFFVIRRRRRHAVAAVVPIAPMAPAVDAFGNPIVPPGAPDASLPSWYAPPAPAAPTWPAPQTFDQTTPQYARPTYQPPAYQPPAYQPPATAEPSSPPSAPTPEEPADDQLPPSEPQV